MYSCTFIRHKAVNTEWRLEVRTPLLSISNVENIQLSEIN